MCDYIVCVVLVGGGGNIFLQQNNPTLPFPYPAVNTRNIGRVLIYFWWRFWLFLSCASVDEHCKQVHGEPEDRHKNWFCTFIWSIWNITRCILGLHTDICTHICDSVIALSLIAQMFPFIYLSHVAKGATWQFLPQNHMPQNCYAGIFLLPPPLTTASSKWGSKSILGFHTQVP